MADAPGAAPVGTAPPPERARRRGNCCVRCCRRCRHCLSLRCLPTRLPGPPDRGLWAWLPVAASFVVYSLVVGVETSYGVLFSAMLQEFPTAREGLSWVNSIAVFLELMLGLGVGGLVVRWGARVVCFFGGLAIFIGLLLSASAPSVDMLYATYSFCVGIGLALSYVSASAAVSLYFTAQRRAVANGIATSGAGVGTVVISAVMQYLIARADWRTCLRVLAFVCGGLVMAVSLVFIPVEKPGKPGEKTGVVEEVAGAGRLEGSNSGGGLELPALPHAVPTSSSSGSSGEEASGSGEDRVGAEPPHRGSQLRINTTLPSASGVSSDDEGSGSGGGGGLELVSTPLLGAVSTPSGGFSLGQPQGTRTPRPAMLRSGGGSSSSLSSLAALPPAASTGSLGSPLRRGVGVTGSGPGIAGAGSRYPSALSLAGLDSTEAGGSGTPSLDPSPQAAGTKAAGSSSGPLLSLLPPRAPASTSSSSASLDQQGIRRRASSAGVFAIGDGASASTGSLEGIAAAAAEEGKPTSPPGAFASSSLATSDAVVSLVPYAQSSSASAGLPSPRLAPLTAPRRSPSLAPQPNPPDVELRDSIDPLPQLSASQSKPTTTAAAAPVIGPLRSRIRVPWLFKTARGGASAASSNGPPKLEDVDENDSDNFLDDEDEEMTFDMARTRKRGVRSALPGAEAGPTSAGSPGGGAAFFRRRRGGTDAATTGLSTGGGSSGNLTYSGGNRGSRAEAGTVRATTSEDSAGGSDDGAGALANGAGASSAAVPGAVGANSAIAAHRRGGRRPAARGIPCRDRLATRVCADPRFWIVAVGLAIYVAAMTIIEVHLVTSAMEAAGMDAGSASGLTTVQGVAGIVGRVVFTLIAMVPSIPLLTQYQICTITTGMAIFALAIYNTSPGYLFFASVVFGGVGGAGNIYGFISPTMAEFFGPAGLPYALGGTYSVRAPLVLCAAPFAGWLREQVGSYASVWTICGVLMVVSAFPVFILQCLRSANPLGLPPPRYGPLPTREGGSAKDGSSADGGAGQRSHAVVVVGDTGTAAASAP